MDLERIELEGGALYAQGAHVSEWNPEGHRPVLFMSGKNSFAAGKAIRGGVPIIFPWFGSRPEGAHGWARTRVWEVVQQGRNEASLALESGPFRLTFWVRFFESLSMRFEIENISDEPQAVEMALHTYLAVSDIAEVSVSGLEGVEYLDKVDEFRRKTQTGDIRIAGPTDRVYLGTAGTCVVHDAGWSRRIEIAKSGSQTTVVWNPWSELADLDNWRGMICVETANAADNAVSIGPRQTHTMSAGISVTHGT